MTELEKENAELCARFMGWHYEPYREYHSIDPEDEKYASEEGYWVDEKGNGVSAGSYNPASDTPAGREQANELWNAVDKKGFFLLFFDNGKCVQIQDANTIAESKFYVEGKGDWWNSALTAAVAELQLEIERKAND